MEILEVKSKYGAAVVHMSAAPYALLFPVIRAKLRPPDGKPPEAWDERREGSVLKRLLIHRSSSQLEVAIHGLAALRDSGQINWLQPGAKVTSRALYNTRSGVSQMFELATREYWRTAKRPARKSMSSVGDILFGLIRHSVKYREYLRSPEWKARRQRALAAASHRCSRCHQIGGALDVHHLNYERFGAEHDGDLQVLCRVCHDVEHGKLRPERTSPHEVVEPRSMGEI